MKKLLGLLCLIHSLHTAQFQEHLTDDEQTKLIQSWNAHDIFHFGYFTLKSDLETPFYIDFKKSFSHPSIFQETVQLLSDITAKLSFDSLCAVPYGAYPFALALAYKNHYPLLVCHKEQEGKQVIGNYKKDHVIVMVEDIITTSQSCLNTVQALERKGLIIKDIIALVGYKSGIQELVHKGYNVHVLMTFEHLVDHLTQSDFIKSDTKKHIMRHTTYLPSASNVQS